MQESFWWWQCSDRYIIPLFSHPRPSLISLLDTVDVKYHERNETNWWYILQYGTVNGGWTKAEMIIFRQTVNKWHSNKTKYTKIKTERKKRKTINRGFGVIARIKQNHFKNTRLPAASFFVLCSAFRLLMSSTSTYRSATPQPAPAVSTVPTVRPQFICNGYAVMASLTGIHRYSCDTEKEKKWKEKKKKEKKREKKKKDEKEKDSNKSAYSPKTAKVILISVTEIRSKGRIYHSHYTSICA